VRVLQFFSVILTALALVPGGAHVLELPAKIALSQQDYFVTQSIYRVWALFGIVDFPAIAANFLLAVMLWRRGRPYWAALAAGLILAATLVIFFEWTYPANQVTNNWRMVIADWEGCAGNGSCRTRQTRS
jgi:hypothetical protein